jgi:rod shape-determining protein MreC
LQREKGFNKIWIWIVFTGFALFLLSTNPGPNQSWNPAEQLIIEVTTPFQKLIKLAVGSVEKLWTDYFYLVGLKDENRRLNKDIDLLKTENSRYKELLATHARLRKLLQFKQIISNPVIAAQVIGLDPSGWFKSIIVDKGTVAGIEKNMPVVNASGVVGRVISVSPDFSKILLVVDQNSAIDCLLQRSRDRGILKGLSTDVCNLEYLAKTADAAVGDQIITSGLGGVFPKGLPVGKILHISENPGMLFKEIKVRPAVDFSTLEEVMIILNQEDAISR